MGKTVNELSQGKFLGLAVSTAIFLSIVSLAFTSWILMLLLGAVHSFVEWVPALGYGQTVLVVLLIQIIAAVIKSVKG
jgi:hypothetical protein